MALPSNEWFDLHEWDAKAPIFMTPIEAGLWADVRWTGLVLYPQFPIGPYFADFANPKAKVVIECDGRQWHADKAKDAERDDWMARQGWTVYRFTGAQCMQTEQIETDENGYERHRESELVAELRRIGRKHGIKQ